MTAGIMNGQRVRHLVCVLVTVTLLASSALPVVAQAASEASEPAVSGFALPPARTLPVSSAGSPAIGSAGASTTTTNGLKGANSSVSSSASTSAAAASTSTSTSTSSTGAPTSFSSDSLLRSSAASGVPGIQKKETIASLPPLLSSKPGAVQETMLPNGLRVLILEQREFPVVSTLMWYRTGSRAESSGLTGLSHLVEHLLFQNVGSFKEGEIGAAIARSGGQFNGYTSDDFITFFETLPSGRLELALKIESERMRQAKFEESAVAREVSNIQKEFENEERDPVSMVSREVRAMLFMQHPYHNPVLGWRTDLENLNARQAKEFYDRYFQPANATLVICGDVNSKNSLALVQKYFGAIPSTPPAVERYPIESAPRNERRVAIRYGGKQEILQIGWHAPALESGDAAAMVVLEKILNGGLNGRLKQRLVDAKLCAGASASYEIKKEPGFFTITTSAIPATLNAQQKMIDGIDAVLASLRDKPLADAELRRARNQATYAFYSECDGPYRAGFHLGYFDALDKWQSNYTWPERLKAVTANDVMRVAKKYLVTDGRVIGWVQGTAAPKPASVPPPKSGSDTKEHEKPFQNKLEHVRMSGYKSDDSSQGPGDKKSSASVAKKKTEEAAAVKKKDTSSSVKSDASAGKCDKSEKSEHKPVDTKKTAEETKQGKTVKGESTASAAASSKSDKKDSPKQPDKTAAQATTRPATRSIPRLIEDIPEALGKAVTGTIPGAVGNVGNAIRNVPGAIGEIGAAVGHKATAIGNKIVQFGPHTEPVNGRVSRRVLKNGVNLLVFESHVNPLVHIAGAIEAGDVYNPIDKPGVSSVASAVLNQGGPKHSRAQMLSMQDDMGLPTAHMLRFENRMETIDFTASCLSKDLSAQLDLVAECVSTPLLDDASLDHCRQEALAVLKKSEDSMSQKVDRVLMQCLLAEKSPYCPADPSDKSKSIASVNASDLQKFFQAHVTPGATTIVLAGDIQPDAAASLMERAFANWAGRSAHQQLHAKESAKRVLRTAIPSKDSKKSTICFGQLVPIPASHSDYGSLLIADGILVNHPMVSRFEQQIAKTPALEIAMNNSEMAAGLDPVSNLTKWSLTISVEPNAVPVSVQTIKRELRQLSKTGVTPEEFAEVRRYLIGSIGVRDESTLYRVARNELDLAQHGGTVDGYAAVVASLKSATADSVNRVIRTSFKPEQATLVIAGSAQSIRAVRTKTGETGSNINSNANSPADANRPDDDQ